jgi:tetratricopeptide (TPR) repeat protein
METFAGRLTDADKAPFAGRLREARFVEGDLLFCLGDYASAYRAYGEAVRRTSGPEERLRGLIGRARTLARLDRIEEARKEYSRALATFGEDRDKTYGARGREYWEVALEALAREVR